MRNETILCIAPRVWHSLWRDTQPVMWRIAKQNRVLYFEPGRNPDRRHSAEMWRNLPNLWTLRAQALHRNLILIPTPSCLPFMRRRLPRPVLQVTMPWVAKVNVRILIRHVHRAMRAYGVKDPILWLYSPFHVDLMGQFGEKLTCYYNYDEFADFVHNSRIKGLVRQFDDRLTSRVDVVFATSRAQYGRRKAINPNTHFVPNGVDFELFNQALAPDLPLPADIADVPTPIIGFAGWMGYHMNVGLLRKVADAYPHCSLVLVGPDELPSTAEKEGLLTRSNVHFLGQKDRQELPGYLRMFDTAIMPYSLDGHILSSYPLKLHEYLAAGRDIVSVALPELRPYHHVLRIAETHEEFLRHIGAALADDSAEQIEARVAVARENTWDQRVTQIYRILQQHLPSLDSFQKGGTIAGSPSSGDSASRTKA